MNSESPPIDPVSAIEEDNKRKLLQRKRFATAAAVGLLAFPDAQADTSGAPQSEPTAVIRYEPSLPNANASISVDKNGRASLPAESFQSPAELPSTSDNAGDPTSVEENPGRTVLFSEYQKGKVPSADPEVVNEQYYERRDRLQGESRARALRDFRTSGEQEIDARVARTERVLHISESMSWAHEQVRGLLSRVAEVTGADPTGSIQKTGDLLVSGSVAFADAVLADKIRALAVRSLMAENTRRANEIGGSAIFQGEAKNAALVFDVSRLNARNMLLQYTLGSKSGGWELTFGADPGKSITGMAKGKLDPAVGVIFRLKLP